MLAKGIPADDINFDFLSKIIPINVEKRYKYTAPEKKQKRKVYLALGAFFIILIIAVAIFFLFFAKKPEHKIDIFVPDIPKQNLSNNSMLCDDSCQLQSAIKSKVVSNCEKINNSKKQDCFEALAIESIDACLKLDNYSQKKNCVELHATKNEDVRLCDNLDPNDAIGCIEKADPCYYKTDEKQLCKALLKNNYSFCEKDEQCLFTFAQKTKNVNACSDIDTVYKQSACASVTLRKDQCISLPKLDEVDACREIYSIETNQSDECGFIRSDTVYAVNCYAYFAERDMNPSVCDGVEILKRWDCYKKYALESGDIQGCIQIDKYAPISKEHCIIDFGKLYGNPQVCTYLDFDPGSRDVCFRAAIQDNSRLRHEKCANLNSDEWNVRCYTNAAILERNISICDLQENKVDADFCKTNYK